MDKSLYISININNMGGVVLFPPLPRLFIPMAKGDFLHPLVRRAAFLFYQLTINLV